jgi:hypothetical protein
VSDDAAAALERIRAITARAAQEARGAAIAAGPPPDPALLADRSGEAKPERGAPPLHWQEEAEERALEVRQVAAPTRLQLEAGDVAARETACARLRTLLADGRWHSALELVEAGGLRYGGRLHEIRRGEDGGRPLDVEAEPREHAGRQVWHYRTPRRT